MDILILSITAVCLLNSCHQSISPYIPKASSMVEYKCYIVHFWLMVYTACIKHTVFYYLHPLNSKKDCMIQMRKCFLLVMVCFCSVMVNAQRKKSNPPP